MAARDAMIIHDLEILGLYPFPDEPVRVPLRTMESLVSVSGPNGSGKTSILDAICAGLYGMMAYRPGSLAKQFVKRGHIILTWETDGRVYRSHLKCDPVSERTEATLYDDAEHVIAGPHIREFRKAVESILGPFDLWLSAAYAVQSGVGSFLKATRPERRDLLSELLGLKRFPVLHERASKRLAATETEHEVLRARIADLSVKVATKAAVQAQHDEMKERLTKAEERLVGAQDALTKATEARDQAKVQRAELEPLRTRVDVLTREIAALNLRLADHEAKRITCDALLRRADEITAAVTQAAALREDIATLDGEITRARDAYNVALKAANAAHLTRQAANARLVAKSIEQARLERQVVILKTVPCHGAGAYAGCTYLKDARAAGEALPAVTAEVAAAQDALAALPGAFVPEDSAAPLLATRTRRVAALNALQALTQQAPALEAARARLEEVGAAIEQAERERALREEERTAASERLAALPLVSATLEAAQAGVQAAETARHDALGLIQAATMALGRIEGQRDSVLAAEVEAEDLTARLAPLVVDCAEWALLTKALSPSGIPALLIDQALPEIGRLATELLRECFGESVFSIALTTQRESANGDKLLETLDVVVTRGAQVIDAALLSGGESVLVSESLSLAIALYSATRSGRRIRTLLRDEVGAALDIARGPAYVRMLRRAVTLGGFRHVLYVSHMPACIDLADAQIEVRDGKVAVS